MRTSSVFAVLATSPLAHSQQVIQVAVGGRGAAPTFTPNNFNAANGTIIQFQFTGTPGNHTVTQSSFAQPCEPLAGGFDSGWINVPGTALNPPPEWNITVTNDQSPIWFHCKQLKKTTGPKPHCNLGMVGVINIGANNFDAWTASAAAATTVGQAQGGLGGIGATATTLPFIPSGAALVTGVPIAASGGTLERPSDLPTSLSGASNTSPSSTSSEAFPAPGPSRPSQLGQAAKKPPVGAIVGGIVGALFLVTAALWWRRRQRLRPLAKDLAPPQPYTAQTAANDSLPVQGQSPQHSKRTPNGGGSSTPAMASGLSPDIPTSELVLALYQRMHTQDFAGAPSPPPAYV
ncbi:hypothetical protein MVEN_00162800 [Mycena venus]|uniref:Extracellular serine-rich protein n=1 Tax=Mycena venus TaxID=2733690 RepID=A0A8H6Z0X6_9AGAR|nr:hypothetical protein MVEN_00162800 [Mycena venus]